MTTSVLEKTVVRPRSGMRRVQVFRSLGEAEALREVWTAWGSHPNSDIDFYRMIAQTRESSGRPYIVVAYCDDEPEAMLVGRLEDSRIDINFGYAKLPSPSARVLNVVYQGILGNITRESSQCFVAGVQEALANREADAAIFRYLRSDVPIYQELTSAVGKLQRDYCVASQIHRGMTLPESPESLHSRFSAKVRKNHRWQANKLIQDHQGDVRIECLREPSELDAIFRDVDSVARNTYQRGLGVGFVDTPEMRSRLGFESENGWLRAYVLYVAGRPSAFWIGSVYRNTFFSSFMGYDPSLARYSPGMFLVMRVIEGFCSSSSREVNFIDFGLGDAEYKRLLGDTEWNEASVHVFAPTLKGVAVNLLRTPATLLEAEIKRAAQGPLSRKIKQIWRHRASRKLSRG